MNSRLKDEIHLQLIEAAKAWYVNRSPIKSKLFNVNLAEEIDSYSQNELNNLLSFFLREEHQEIIISSLTNNLINSPAFNDIVVELYSYKRKSNA